MKKNKDLNYYLSLPYTIRLMPDPEDGGYVAMIEELSGCMSQGDTYQEAMDMIEDAKKGWLAISLEDNLRIPEPKIMSDDYSGKFLVRMPKSLHRFLSTNAEQSSVSLNQFVVDALEKTRHGFHSQR